MGTMAALTFLGWYKLARSDDLTPGQSLLAATIVVAGGVAASWFFRMVF